MAEYIVKEDDGYNWARWKVKADSREELIKWWNENGLDEDNAELIDHTHEMPYCGILEIESEAEKVCKKCDGYGWVADTTLKGYKDCDSCNKTGSEANNG